ncbi:GNAT family N-acetyltransferase [Oceanobacillus bengalensis]|uniref:N-acetyltransferase n=1 Tax=Oceanobacillus bengalensis TaxID=1435466 RepID=A0A494Z3T1_9BACI|nr:GNAT family N-acetyltransferase [Oceanobacillus bengalensis]RKQ17177.1 N-acetyltransferase [Oceanobacillus bengalensis]
MTLVLSDNKNVFIRPYEEGDFNKIQDLNKEEGWSNLVENHLNTKEAWKNSNVSYVAETEDQQVVGYIRGFTDSCIGLFICELLTDKKYRGLGLGRELIRYVHNIYPKTRVELLANSSSRTFYEGLGFRAFYGFRKISHE